MGDLLQSVDTTELGPNAPVLDTITSYPSTTTGTPTYEKNPGPPKNFVQPFTSTSTYLDKIKNQGSPFLSLGKEKIGLVSTVKNIFDATDLDTSKPGVKGGIPYKTLKDPTVYPATTQKVGEVRGPNNVQGQGADKFTQKFSSGNTYLDSMNPYT